MSPLNTPPARLYLHIRQWRLGAHSKPMGWDLHRTNHSRNAPFVYLTEPDGSDRVIFYIYRMNYQERIVSDHRILLGKPVIKGTRISVELILKELSEGASVADLCDDYKLSNEDIQAVLEYASARIANEDDLVIAK